MSTKPVTLGEIDFSIPNKVIDGGDDELSRLAEKQIRQTVFDKDGFKVPFPLKRTVTQRENTTTVEIKTGEVFEKPNKLQRVHSSNGDPRFQSIFCDETYP